MDGKGDIKSRIVKLIEETKKQGERGWLELFCNAGVYFFLFFLVLIYAFYAPEGYIKLATNKYEFFRKVCRGFAVVMIPPVFLYATAPVNQGPMAGKSLWERGKSAVLGWSCTDWFVAAFILCNSITFLYTDFRGEALWGTDGWYMGFLMQMVFVGIYYFLSRFYDGRIPLFPFFMSVAFILFFWGLLNRFSVYPVDMQYTNAQYISSMGNINWFSGFWSVFFSIGTVLFLVTKNRYGRIFSGIYAAAAMGIGAVEGSSTAHLSLAAVFLLLFVISFQKTEYMKRLLELGMIFCGVCQIMRCAAALFPGSLNMRDDIIDFLLGNITLILFFVLAGLRYLLGRGERNFMKQKAEPGREYAEKFRWLRFLGIRIIIAICGAYLLLLILNTNRQGSIGALSGYGAFYFNDNWGNGRGAAIKDAFHIFESLPFSKKLFGVGQDCFAAYGYSNQAIAESLNAHWGGARLTNAHNECITILVNMGILGLLSFVGIFFSSIGRLLKEAKQEPVCYVFAASLLSYFIHNQFSFAQILSTPYVFMMLGLAESLLRRQGNKVNKP